MDVTACLISKSINYTNTPTPRDYAVLEDLSPVDHTNNPLLNAILEKVLVQDKFEVYTKFGDRYLIEILYRTPTEIWLYQSYLHYDSKVGKMVPISMRSVLIKFQTVVDNSSEWGDEWTEVKSKK